MLLVATLFALLATTISALLLNVPQLLHVGEAFATSALVVWASYKLAAWLRWDLLGRTLASAGKAVLITGCDTGFGKLLAVKLAAKGYHVYAGCLFSKGEGAEELARTSGVTVLQLDVRSDDDVQNAYEAVKKSLGDKVLWAVMLNAGTLNLGLVEWQSMEQIRTAFDVNVLGAVRVSKKFLPLLKESQGRLVIVTSLLAHFTMPLATVYCMCKHATSSLAEGLRRECLPFGVHVSSVEPTGFLTQLVAGKVEQMEAEMKHARKETLVSADTHQIDAACVASLKLVVGEVMSSKLYQVTDAMTLAIEEASPRLVYFAGNRIHRLLQFLPPEWMDSLLLILFKFMKWWTPVPNLSKSN